LGLLYEGNWKGGVGWFEIEVKEIGKIGEEGRLQYE
jgi:hypothetical protein